MLRCSCMWTFISVFTHRSFLAIPELVDVRSGRIRGLPYSQSTSSILSRCHVLSGISTEQDRRAGRFSRLWRSIYPLERAGWYLNALFPREGWHIRDKYGDGCPCVAFLGWADRPSERTIQKVWPICWTWNVEEEERLVSAGKDIEIGNSGPVDLRWTTRKCPPGWYSPLIFM